MTHTRKKSSSSSTGKRAAAFVLTGAVASLLSYSYALALKDGGEWRTASEQWVISPSLEVADPSNAKQVPDFVLKDRNGKEIKLSDFSAADIILVNIWTTGCPTCRSELPSLTEMDKRLASLGKVLLITITTAEKWEEVEHLFPRGTKLRVLFDPEEKVTKEVFGTTRYPETFILDKKRRIRVRFDGERSWHIKPMLKYIASFKS